jgi:hypothetical protein
MERQYTFAEGKIRGVTGIPLEKHFFRCEEVCNAAYDTE